jgi:hypothetical protein
MTSIAALQIPAPKDWQAFERLCFDLWSQIWDDEYAQQNGRTGQRQNGVDVFGRNRKDRALEGVQCKGKDGRYDSALTATELLDEVKKARSFQPPLGRFILVTSGQTDVAVQELARKLSEEHATDGLFLVEVQSWDHIVARFLDYPDVFAHHYRTIFESVLRIASARSKKPLIAIRHQSQQATSPAFNEINTEHLGRPVFSIDCDASLTYEGGVMKGPQAALFAQTQLARDITSSLQRFPESELAYYGIAHIPLVFHAGAVISNKRTVRLFELGRLSGQFRPIEPGNGADLGITLSADSNPHNAYHAVIRIGISYPIPMTDVRQVIQRPFRGWNLTVREPKIDLISHEGQIEQLASFFRQVLDEVHNAMPPDTPLHVFCSAPVSAVFRLGQTISRTIHGPVFVYNYSARETPKYSWALDVNAPEGSPRQLWMAQMTL